jgi:hypothetical protein
VRPGRVQRVCKQFVDRAQDAVGVREPRGGAESRGTEHALLDQLGCHLARCLLGRVAGEAVRKRDNGGSVLQRALGVERADLDRAQAGVRAKLPPEPRVVCDVGGAGQAIGHRAEVIEVTESPGRPRTGPAPHRHLTRRGEPRIAAVAKRRVGGQRLEQGQVATEVVEGADGGVGVGHSDVHVQAAHRRNCRVPEQIADVLVAVLIGDLGLALDR